MGRVDLLPLVVRPYWFDENAKILTLGFEMDSNYRSSKLTSFFFIGASNCLFKVFIYLIPFELIFHLLPFLHCFNLLSLSSSKIFDFHERIWYCITFFQLEGRCSNCNHFYKSCKTERCKCKNRAELLYQVTNFLIHYLFSLL